MQEAGESISPLLTLLYPFVMISNYINSAAESDIFYIYAAREALNIPDIQYLFTFLSLPSLSHQYITRRSVEHGTRALTALG